jgi:hypothetical protein
MLEARLTACGRRPFVCSKSHHSQAQMLELLDSANSFADTDTADGNQLVHNAVSKLLHQLEVALRAAATAAQCRADADVLWALRSLAARSPSVRQHGTQSTPNGCLGALLCPPCAAPSARLHGRPGTADRSGGHEPCRPRACGMHMHRREADRRCPAQHAALDVRHATAHRTAHCSTWRRCGSPSCRCNSSSK